VIALFARALCVSRFVVPCFVVSCVVLCRMSCRRVCLPAPLEARSSKLAVKLQGIAALLRRCDCGSKAGVARSL
jgi:hypothetical protein